MSAVTELALRALADLAWLTAASTVVYAVVRAVNRLVPAPAAGLRHGLLLLVLLRMVVPPGVTSPLSAGRLLEALPGGIAAAPAGDGGTSLHGPLAAAVPTRGTASPTAWPTVLLGAWLIGAVVAAVRRGRERRRFHRLAAAGRSLGDGVSRAALRRWRRRLGVRRPVRLVAVPAPVMPFTVGTLRPAIVLPEQLLDASDRGAAVETVVAHELAHVARLDDLWLALEQVVTALFFFHPVAWLTARALGVERELAADRRVLATGRLSPRRYGRALLGTLGLNLTTTTVAAAAGSRRRIAMRIRHIADPRTSTRPGRLHGFVAVASFLLLAAVLLPPPVASETPEGAPTASVALVVPAAPGPDFDDLMPGARVTSPFGMRRDPFGGESALHGGVDLGTGEESPVFAPRGGIVEVATEDWEQGRRWGTVVIVDHGGGVKTFYAHLSRLTVETGQGVSDGDPIGFAGSTGVSSGPHLHFEIWKDGEKVDPARMAEVLGAR